MNQDVILDLSAKALMLVLIISMPPIIMATVVGLIVAVIQALTQIQEQTLSFAVKLIVVTITLLAVGYWLGGELFNFSVETFDAIADVGR